MACDVKKISGITFLLACSMSTACLAATPEQDIAIQKLGLEYNRRYDLEHGYAVSDYVPDTSLVPAPEEEEFPAGPVKGAEDDVSDVDIDLSMVEEEENRDALHSREVELDDSIQEAGKLYNQRFDLANGYTENEASRIGRSRTGEPETVPTNPVVSSSEPSGGEDYPRSPERPKREVTFPKPEKSEGEKRFVVAGERDRMIQEAAQNYNQQYDMRFGYMR